jgi:glycosyltransferase involved in cell wall biosynthesis
MNCRILYTLGQLRDGGLERQLYYLLQTMDRDRYQPHVVVWNFREEHKYVSKIKALQVPLYGFPCALSRFEKLKEARMLAHQLRPDIIHSYGFYTNFGAWHAARGTSAIPIGSVRSDFRWAKNEVGLLLGRLCARWPRHQIFNSIGAAEKARADHGLFAPRRVSVVRNGIDLMVFKNSPLPMGSTVRILGIGSLVPVKRWDRLITAASRLNRQGLDFVVRIVGDGPLRKGLGEQVKELNLVDCVQFVDRTDEVAALLSESTFLVHTSDNEGCPNVIMEAMACGRAVIATDAGDAASLIEDGTTGFVVRRGDDEALLRRMTTLIGRRDYCERMGQAGRAKAEREFALERLLAETFAAYRSAGWTDPSDGPQDMPRFSRKIPLCQQV